jgi:hypothetical protein
MRTSYIYYFNKEPISRKELLKKLEEDCQHVIHTDYAGNIGIDLMGLDKPRYNQCIRDIEKGTSVVFMKSGNRYCRKVR